MAGGSYKGGSFLGGEQAAGIDQPLQTSQDRGTCYHGLVGARD